MIIGNTHADRVQFLDFIEYVICDDFYNMKYMIDECGYNVDKFDQHGKTALHVGQHCQQ